jgi:DNA-binding MarR family transcriptional regulator
LEGQKLISRREDEEDRRQVLIAITEKGTKMLRRDIGERRARLAHVIEKELTPAEQSMLAVATQLMDRLAQALGSAKSPKSIANAPEQD